MHTEAFLDALQWPAMAVTLLAAWLVASQQRHKRNWGFWCFIASNVLWIAWGWHARAHALIVLQLGLFALNVRGACKNDTADAGGSAHALARRASRRSRRRGRAPSRH